MHVTVFNGQPAPVGGLFVDGHGHVIYLRSGDLAPICPVLGPATTVRWRLVREVAEAR